jgi:hypothetical protein
MSRMESPATKDTEEDSVMSMLRGYGCLLTIALVASPSIALGDGQSHRRLRSACAS